MRIIQTVLVVLLVLLVVGQIFTTAYLQSQDRMDPPVMTCPPNVLEVSAGDPKSVLLQGVTAVDTQDGDLSGRIVIGNISRLLNENTAKVTLLVFDSDNNMGMCTRYIRYTDYHRPRFAVYEPLICDTAEDLSIVNRLSAYDVIDGDITKDIRISLLSSTQNPELYLVTAQVMNSLGDIALQELPVLIQDYDPLRPEILLTEYLTYVDKDTEFDAQQYLRSAKILQRDIPLEYVTVASSVDTSKPGTYHVFYTYNETDSVGTAILTVVVQ